MIVNLSTKLFKQYHINKHFSQFYPQDGGENQLAQIWNEITTSLSPYVLQLNSTTRTRTRARHGPDTDKVRARCLVRAKFHYTDTDTDTGPTRTRTRTFLWRNSVGSVRVRFAAKKSVSVSVQWNLAFTRASLCENCAICRALSAQSPPRVSDDGPVLPSRPHTGVNDVVPRGMIFSPCFCRPHVKPSRGLRTLQYAPICMVAQKSCTSLDHHIDATVQDKMKRISPKCSRSFCE